MLDPRGEKVEEHAECDMSSDKVESFCCALFEEMAWYGGAHVLDGDRRGYELGAFLALFVFRRVTSEPWDKRLGSFTSGASALFWDSHTVVTCAVLRDGEGDWIEAGRTVEAEGKKRIRREAWTARCPLYIAPVNQISLRRDADLDSFSFPLAASARHGESD